MIEYRCRKVKPLKEKKMKDGWSSQIQLTGSLGSVSVCNTDMGYMYVIAHFTRNDQMRYPTTNPSQNWWKRIVRGAETRSYRVSFVAIRRVDELMSRCTTTDQSAWCVGPKITIFVTKSFGDVWLSLVSPYATNTFVFSIRSLWYRCQNFVINRSIFGGSFNIMSLIHPSFIHHFYPQVPRG